MGHRVKRDERDEKSGETGKDDRSRRSEVRDQRTEGIGKRTEGRGRRSEVRDQRTEGNGIVVRFFEMKSRNMPRGSSRKSSYICYEKRTGPFINFIYKQ